MELEQDLRLTSDELMHSLERLRELELEKRRLSPGTARFKQIAAEVERVAATIFAKSVQQDELAQETVELREHTGLSAPTIENVEPLREIQVILNEWREAERRLAAAAHGTPEHLEAQSAVQRLRNEYRRTSQAAESAD
jgi:hypothetical protein